MQIAVAGRYVAGGDLEGSRFPCWNRPKRQDLHNEAPLGEGRVLAVAIFRRLITERFAQGLQFIHNGVRLGGLHLELERADGLVVALPIQVGGDDPAADLLDPCQHGLVGGLGVGRRHIEVDGFARGHVGKVVERQEELGVLPRHSAVLRLAGAALGLQQPVDLEPGLHAELLEPIADRPRHIGRDFEMDERVELPGLELFEFRFRDPALDVGHDLQCLCLGLLDILDLDAHVDALGFQDAEGGADFLLGQGDGERAEGNLASIKA